MLSLFLSQGTDGLSFALQLGSQDAVLGFVWWPFPALLLGCVAMFCFAGFSAGRGPRGYDPRGGYRRGPSRFWAIMFAVAVVVLVSRGMKEHVHTTIVVDPDNRPVAAVAVERRRERLDEAVTRLERQLDRASDQVDRALAHGAAQIDRQVDHGTDQMSRQLDKGAADMAQQLEHAAAQLIREIEHLGHQVAQRHHDVPAAHTITVTTPTTEAAVTEPNAPALPVAGAHEVEVVVAAPSAPPSSPAAPAAVQARPTPPTAPAAPSAAPVTAAAPQASPASSPSADVAGEKLPAWAKTEIVDEDNRKLVVVQGGFAGTQSEAEHDTLEAARLVLGDAIQRAYPKVGKWLPPAESVREVAVRLTYVEKIPRKTLSSGTPFIVYRAYKQVELSPAVYSQLLSSWKEEVVPHRLEALAGFAALLTLTFATGAAYFRLDDRTQGRYRGRLKVAAVAVIGAGAAAAAALI
jgi:hypothetical protein